jgi:hypothetical protein
MREVSGNSDPAVWGDLGVVVAFVLGAQVLGALT